PTSHAHHRSLAFPPPRRALHAIGAETRLIPKVNLRATGFGLLGHPRIGLALPPSNRFGIALVGALQRLLRNQAQLRQQLAHCRDPEPYSELALDQLCDDLARPQGKVESVLPRVLAGDSAIPLPLLCRSKRARASRRLARDQCAKTFTAPARRAQPPVDRGAAEAIRSAH